MRASERRFLHSTLAAYSSQLARTAIRAASDLILARLILPSGHGLFDQALGVAVVAGLFRDLGLPYQLVRDEERPYGSVLLWNTAAGLLITALLVFAAPLAGAYDPNLPPVLRVYAVYVLLDGLSVVPRVFFERELAVGRLVLPEIARGCAIALVSIPLAVTGAGVWALVAGQLTGAALFAALLWRRAWGRIPLRFDPRPIPGLIRRSFYLFLIALAALPVPSFSRFVLGWGLGGARLDFWVGEYGKARDWGFRLQELLLPAVARVLYPALVDYRRLPEERHRFLGAYRMGTVSILALETLAAYFLFFNATALLVGILGPNWRSAVPLLEILAFVPLADPFSPLGGELLKVEREDRGWLLIVTLNLASLVGFGYFLTRRMGPPGIAWANYLLLGNLVMTWRVCRICGAEFWRMAGDLLFVYLLPLPLFLAVAHFFQPATWSRFAASLVAAAAAGMVYVWRFHAPFRAFFSAEARGEAAAPAS